MSSAEPRLDPSNCVDGIVRRGFITRFATETEWTAKLIAVAAGAELVDADACPYYVRGDDGKFREFYGFSAPQGLTVFMLRDRAERE